MKKIFIILIFLVFSFLAIYFRFINLKNNYMYFDNGYELEAARLINQKKQLPLIGPAVGIKNFFIPPTYLYLLAIIYSFNNDIYFISGFFAFLGLLTVYVFSYFIYLLTNKKLLSLLTLVIFSVWNYHIMFISRKIWHPNPVYFFLSLSLLFATLALKNKKIFNLLLGQLFFFISLSIYPSPVFFLPIIIFHSYYFFKNNMLLRKTKSIFYTILSMFINCFIIYFPQLIFEFKTNFVSFSSLINFNSNQVIKPIEILNHFKAIFKSFFYIFFYTKNSNLIPLFFVFFLVIILLIFVKKHNPSFYQKPFTSFFVLIWIICMLLFMKDINQPDSFHRFDVLNLLFFIWLLMILNEKNRFANLFNKVISSLIIIFLIIFLLSNLKKVSRLTNEYSFESISTNQRISQLIINYLNEKNIQRDEILTFNALSQINKEAKGHDFLWNLKWQAERIDHFINKEFNYNNSLVENYQCTLNYNHELDYLDANYYFLVCKSQDEKCLSNFSINLSLLNSKAYNKHQFILQDELSFDDHRLVPISVYFVSNYKFL